MPVEKKYTYKKKTVTSKKNDSKLIPGTRKIVERGGVLSIACSTPACVRVGVQSCLQTIAGLKINLYNIRVYIPPITQWPFLM